MDNFTKAAVKKFVFTLLAYVPVVVFLLSDWKAEYFCAHSTNAYLYLGLPGAALLWWAWGRDDYYTGKLQEKKLVPYMKYFYSGGFSFILFGIIYWALTEC